MATKTKRSSRPPARFDDFLLDSATASFPEPSSSPGTKVEPSIPRSPPSADSVQALLEFERLKNENLKMTLQIKQAELEISRLEIQKTSGKVPAMAPASTKPAAATALLQEPPHSSPSEWLRSMDFPTLDDLRRNKQAVFFLMITYLPAKVELILIN